MAECWDDSTADQMDNATVVNSDNSMADSMVQLWVYWRVDSRVVRWVVDLEQLMVDLKDDVWVEMKVHPLVDLMDVDWAVNLASSLVVLKDRRMAHCSADSTVYMWVESSDALMVEKRERKKVDKMATEMVGMKAQSTVVSLDNVMVVNLVLWSAD